MSHTYGNQAIPFNQQQQQQGFMMQHPQQNMVSNPYQNMPMQQPQQQNMMITQQGHPTRQMSNNNDMNIQQPQQQQQMQQNMQYGHQQQQNQQQQQQFYQNQNMMNNKIPPNNNVNNINQNHQNNTNNAMIQPEQNGMMNYGFNNQNQIGQIPTPQQPNQQVNQQQGHTQIGMMPNQMNGQYMDRRQMGPPQHPQQQPQAQQQQQQQSQTPQNQQQQGKSKINLESLSDMKMVTIPPLNDKIYIVKNHILGEGSFANTYVATLQGDNKLYACKIIQKQQLIQKLMQAQNPQEKQEFFLKALLNEVQVWKKLDHQNIVRFYDYSETPNNYYFIMEHCEGGDLESFKKKTNRVEEKQAVILFNQLIEGCKYLYDKSVFHRDLKPANVLISDGIAKIADFGFCKLVEQNKEKAMFQTTVGTPYYMSPQILRSVEYSIKCDVWSLGVMFYEILTGTLPWLVPTKSSTQELLEKIMNEPLEFPKSIQLSNEIIHLISNMLQINEEERISMPESLDQIQHILKMHYPTFQFDTNKNNQRPQNPPQQDTQQSQQMMSNSANMSMMNDFSQVNQLQKMNSTNTQNNTHMNPQQLQQQQMANRNQRNKNYPPQFQQQNNMNQQYPNQMQQQFNNQNWNQNQQNQNNQYPQQNPQPQQGNQANYPPYQRSESLGFDSQATNPRYMQNVNYMQNQYVSSQNLETQELLTNNSSLSSFNAPNQQVMVNNQNNNNQIQQNNMNMQQNNMNMQQQQPNNPQNNNYNMQNQYQNAQAEYEGEMYMGDQNDNCNVGQMNYNYIQQQNAPQQNFDQGGYNQINNQGGQQHNYYVQHNQQMQQNMPNQQQQQQQNNMINQNIQPPYQNVQPNKQRSMGDFEGENMINNMEYEDEQQPYIHYNDSQNGMQQQNNNMQINYHQYSHTQQM